MKKALLFIIITAICIYLISSSYYIFIHIDFSNSNSHFTYSNGEKQLDYSSLISSPGFSANENVVRNLMGLPSKYYSYGGVSPLYLIKIIIQLAIAVMLAVFNFKMLKLKKVE